MTMSTHLLPTRLFTAAQMTGIIIIIIIIVIVVSPGVVLARNPTTKIFAQNVGWLVDARLDPLVNPGECASHVHSVYGNADFGARIKKKFYKDNDWRVDFDVDVDAEDNSKYNQTTSELIPNLSSYWVPSLYIWDDTTQKYYLVPSFARPYYRIEHRNNDDSRVHVNPYPPFLRMIVGDASRKEQWQEQETNRDNIRWTLTTYNRKTTNYIENGDWSYLKEMRNSTIIATRGQVELLLKFPNCLAVKGKKKKPVTKSSNFRDHASYTTDVWGDDQRGWCPESHPYPIPRLDLETRYDLKPMRDLLGSDVVNNVGNWRLSTGDASGAGGHADFVSGWPHELMQNIIANCKGWGIAITTALLAGWQ
mmetsp:Transcript_17058/g.19496  ORF Transcript_17058/g.19496 Transcript_17058/m.19496 type:complete len:364 (+) Transcript_17058:134-1225(+)